MNNPHERSYEREITRAATRITSSNLDVLAAQLADENRSMEDRLYDFCVLFTYFRRQKETNKCLDLFERHSETFGDQFIVVHLLSIAIKEKGRKKDLLRSIELARKALSLHPRHTGALHNLAGALYLLAEEDGINTQTSRELLREARDTVEEALDLESNYPKFYATKAEILSGLGDHDTALREIAKAIDKEDSGALDYPLRISDYLSKKLKIELRKSIQTLTEEHRQELLSAMSEARRSNLEILSFFVAIISFTIASINIAVKFAIEDIALLFFLLASALLMAVSGFILLFESRHALRRFVQAFTVAGVIFLVAFGARYLVLGI
jgi:tetratricopeptide (TPR) repeat protein